MEAGEEIRSGDGGQAWGPDLGEEGLSLGQEVRGAGRVMMAARAMPCTVIRHD